MNKIPVGIIGVSGYTGLELIKILLNHPVFEINYVANSQGEQYLCDIHPALKGVFDLKIQKANPKEASKKCSLVFLALPHKNAMSFAKELLACGVKVVDLSADYRLEQKNYESHYATLHTDTQNLSKAVYGLVEYTREKIKKASLVANPGCYPTATLLGLIPFLPYLENSSIFVDAKSGVSGAGKQLTQNTHYPTINENIFSYSPFQHRHQIEIEEKCAILGNKPVKVNFVPHLVPFTQGMLVSIFATLKQTIDPLEILKKCYENEAFIRIRDIPADVHSVRGSNFCDIFAKCRGKDIYINTAIDNLLRGASSQGVVNANLMCHLDENLSIPKIG
ncbi:N-acetyl-gamma-glutamyl-phosphate reductase [Helicobacter sp. 11S03491-1]|uniref:N-acetyl-gamma-glutamyl-phosphate reductase n=1 Tax=Helicobacter sp. 11S03491-1 TaxID=1476196 RepID=UPI000BA57A8B|nr:N-acetyl-gamma-glutamyl-phosphate reductase [Helicobacter sp. 11S03491-1]PAF41977.1 N-acetyl-gamma-glutamyl-phosphate reductase [Helicobacter sp. 11S03491-1]